MTTAELLEAITNRGEFELLANAVLRKCEEDYESLISVGVNAKGEPIRGSTDGFCMVRYSELPRFIWVQHTTTDRTRLRAKWLNETGPERGDLIKAGEEAQQLERDFPNARFTVILSTNQRIPDEPSRGPLLQEVYVKAKNLGVEAVIWEQSKYSGFLDNDRDGQWLRKHFLGIEAERLSGSLLTDLGRQSLDNYKDQQFTSPDSWVAREFDSQIEGYLDGPSCPVILLVGESGSGKSAAAYRFLHRHITSGGRGLHIPQQIVQNSICLEDALEQTLRRLHPALLVGEGHRVPEFIPGSSQFVIAVDDINRTDNPAVLVRNLISWVKPPYLIICPIWPRFRYLARSPKLKSEKDVVSVARSLKPEPEEGVVSVQRMSIGEASRAVEAVAKIADFSLSRIETEIVAGELGFDPMLIGTFGTLLGSRHRADLKSAAKSVVQEFVRKCTEGAAQASKGYLSSDYREALSALTAFMLRKRRLHPLWQELKTWFGDSSEHVNILRDLCHHGQLCKVSDDHRFTFQHDRFLEYFAVETIAGFLDALDENVDVLAEPYYAEMIGQALSSKPYDDAILAELMDRLPLAVVSALRWTGPPDSEYHRSIARRVKEWVRVWGDSRSVPESVRGEVANSFLRMDSPAVLEIVNTSFGLEVHWIRDLARFRNGDTRSVMWYCSVMGIGAYQDKVWRDLVQHARQHHRNSLVDDLRDLLASPQDDNERLGAPVLAGFLGLPELQQPIADWWHSLSDRPKCLTQALWAALRCSRNRRSEAVLDELVVYWAALPDVEEKQRLDRQMGVAERLAPALAAYADEDLGKYLVSQGKSHRALRSPIAHICGLIDMPPTVEFAVRVCAEAQNGLWQGSIASHWANFGNPSLSIPSVERLEDMWSSPENEDAVRRLSFHLWLENVDRNQINVLSVTTAVSPSEPFSQDALWERARLGDMSCVAALLVALKTNTSYFRVAPAVWCEEIMLAARKRLESFSADIPKDYSGGRLDDHYYLAEMLIKVPVEDAESLLLECWDHLRSSRLFVQCALYVGTPRCVEFADSAISEYPDTVNPLECVGSLFGYGLGTWRGYLTLQHLQRLEPYIHHFDETELSLYVGACIKTGPEGAQWCREHVAHSVDSGIRKRYFPTDEDLMELLDVYSRAHPNMMKKWLLEFRERYDLRDPLELVREWLKREPRFGKVHAAALCIEEIGQRQDLEMLNVSLDSSWERQMADAAIGSARFSVCRRTLQ